MLSWIRSKLHGILVRLIAGLVSFFFILGAGSYYFFNRSTKSKVLAKVDGQEINADLVDNIYSDEIKKYYNDHKNKKNSLESTPLDPKKIKQQILSDLVNNKAIINAINNSGFIVIDQQLIDFIKNDPTFHENGRFSLEKYKLLLRNANASEERYQEYLRGQLLLEQLKTSILLSNFITDLEIDNFITKWNQTRSFGFAVIPVENFVSKVVKEITKQNIEDHYNQNKDSFAIPERVIIDYIDIVSDNLFTENIYNKNGNVNEENKAKLLKYYKDHLEYYTFPELVKVRHILISNYLANSIDSEESQTQKKATEILEKLRSKQDFVKLAREFSDDQNSSKEGGDLGWIGKGEMEPEFEKAAFALTKVGEISDIVKTKFGYHIIQLIEKQKSKVNDFSKVIEQVAKHYKEEQTQMILQELLDNLSDPSVKKRDLKEIADEFKLKLEQTSPFTISGTKEGITSYKEVVTAAFDNNNLQHNSGLIKLSEDHFVVLKTITKTPPQPRTLDEVYEEIKIKLQNIAAKDKAEQYSVSFAKKILGSKLNQQTTKIDNVNWKIAEKVNRNDEKINPEILKAAFSLNKNNPQKNLTLKNGDFAVVLLIDIKNGDLKKILTQHEKLKDQIKAQLIYLQSYVEQKLYEEDLLTKAKINFMVDREE